MGRPLLGFRQVRFARGFAALGLTTSPLFSARTLTTPFRPGDDTHATSGLTVPNVAQVRAVESACDPPSCRARDMQPVSEDG